jgi:hypothetical protein
MNLSFVAPYVDCSNALDWEIQQVAFDTVCNDADGAEESRKSPYVCISRNFEFPGTARIEWHDGKDDEGGASIRSALLESNRILIILDKSRTIEITFALDALHFEELKKYLCNMLSNRLNLQ